MIKAGYILIEFDDDPNHWPEIAKNKHLNFTGTHAVQVSTPELAQIIAKHNPNIEVFENRLEQVPNIISSKWERLGEHKPFKIFLAHLIEKEIGLPG